MIPIITILIVVALLGLLGWAIFGPKSDSVSQNGRINASGKYIPISDRQAPEFNTEGFNGETVSLTEFRGKTVILNFWASWCPPCRDEAEIFAELDRSLNPDEVAVVGIAVWDKESDSLGFLAEYGLDFPNAADENGSIAIDYGVAGVPETFFIGPDGSLQGKYPGPVKSVEQVEEILAELGSGS